MNCPNCGNPCGREDRFCIVCDTPVKFQEPIQYGRHIVPISIMSALFLLGLILFFITGSVG